MFRPTLRQSLGALGVAAGMALVPVAAIALTETGSVDVAVRAAAQQAEDPTTTQAPASPEQGAADAKRPDPAAMQAFRQCMTEQGIPAPPKRRGHGRGLRGDREARAQDDQGAATTRPTREQFQAAFEACKDQLPAEVRAKMEQRQAERQAFEQCLADNGLTRPDPNADPSTTPRPDRATIKAAMEACKDLRPAGRGFGRGPWGHWGHGKGGPGCDDEVTPPSATDPSTPDTSTPGTTTPDTTAPDTTTPDTTAPEGTAPTGTGASLSF